MTEFPLPASHLRQEYETQKTLFENQQPIVQRFLESQARQIANGLTSRTVRVRFSLPDRLLIQVRQIGQQATVTIPENLREQSVGNLWSSISGADLHEAILHRLNELEQSPDQAVSTSTSLLRYSTAKYLVSEMLPAGRSVTYRPDDNDMVPSIPIDDESPESAITQASDAIAEQGSTPDVGRGELQSPFVPAARRFYLSQWVAFDGEGQLLVSTEKEAEASIQSMQKYVQILHRASSLAAYMVACNQYQLKRYGILGQLINQGRALAVFKTRAIIQEIATRVKKNSLNRGLSISMPYFDDQNLAMAETSFQVIPAGRIQFIPAFIVRAVRGKQAQVSQDTRLNSSTRKHLLAQLDALETAFKS
ncbi:MAG: hypothetical protein NTW32_16645 [Chloroflexi bacterium]|nr:hypothetical protein [Chloroflexota bacterium]